MIEIGSICVVIVVKSQNTFNIVKNFKVIFYLNTRTILKPPHESILNRFVPTYI